MARSARVIPRGEHGISRSSFSSHALKVLYRLKDCEYRACLVGGCVRDLLVGIQPKDFDVATDATPEEIDKAFRNCRLIGRRFRLAHIHFGREYIEVATFRGHGGDDDDERSMVEGRLIYDNVYGTIEEDARRRDFTVNALFYDIVDFSVIDHVGGYDDVLARRLRMIGDPVERYTEDPVRLLRAVRFAAKLDFSIEPGTEAPLFELGDLLHAIPPARLFEEVLKLFLSGHGESSFRLLRHYGLFGALFPDTERVLAEKPEYLAMLEASMRNTDDRIRRELPVTPAFLFAALLWPPMREHANDLVDEDHAPHEAIHMAAEDLICRQVNRTAVPRRFSVPMRDIWHLQPRLRHVSGKRANKVMENPRFRAAYDFLLLRCESEPELAPLAAQWTELQKDGPPPAKPGSGRKRKRRRGPRKPRPANKE